MCDNNDAIHKRQVLAQARDTNELIHLLAGPNKDPVSPPVRLTAGLHRAAVSEDKARWFTVTKLDKIEQSSSISQLESPSLALNPINEVPTRSTITNDIALDNNQAIISPALRPNPRRINE